MKLNKTKIIATLGPSCSSKTMLNKLIVSGVDVFRINFSHADHKEVERIVNDIKALRIKRNEHVSILGDLQGPKIRLGNVVPETILQKGDNIVFTTRKIKNGNSNRVTINYASFPKDVKRGETVLVDDGKIILKVEKTDRDTSVNLIVIQGGLLSSNKGVNLPSTKISLPALTPKDIKDAKFAAKLGFDWVALSFVRSKNDVLQLREILDKSSKELIPIISKIEKPQAIKKMDQILKVSNGLMVARGDLGIEIPAEEVPLYQKILVKKANEARKPIIIATQMMESMIDNLTPSRAEVNDVANSVMDGADCIMLSGETSIGKYPCEVVKKVGTIISSVEDTQPVKNKFTLPKLKSNRLITKTICRHAALIANEIKASAVCTLTHSGYTGWQISSWRPNCLVLVFTSNKQILSQLNLLWGVKCIYYNKFQSTDKTVEDVNTLAIKNRYVRRGDVVVNLASMPIKDKGQVNTLRITKL
jgi:pyruvate kinase|tara:strand:+ start:19 stop:1443 length:1425 start_codon:yes stop_codon:yes gene_type:complete